jgi:hypothetical protein
MITVTQNGRLTQGQIDAMLQPVRDEIATVNQKFLVPASATELYRPLPLSAIGLPEGTFLPFVLSDDMKTAWGMIKLTPATTSSIKGDRIGMIELDTGVITDIHPTPGSIGDGSGGTYSVLFAGRQGEVFLGFSSAQGNRYLEVNTATKEHKFHLFSGNGNYLYPTNLFFYNKGERKFYGTAAWNGTTSHFSSLDLDSGEVHVFDWAAEDAYMIDYAAGNVIWRGDGTRRDLNTGEVIGDSVMEWRVKYMGTNRHVTKEGFSIGIAKQSVGNSAYVGLFFIGPDVLDGAEFVTNLAQAGYDSSMFFEYGEALYLLIRGGSQLRVLKVSYSGAGISAVEANDIAFPTVVSNWYPTAPWYSDMARFKKIGNRFYFVSEQGLLVYDRGDYSLQQFTLRNSNKTQNRVFVGDSELFYVFGDGIQRVRYDLNFCRTGNSWRELGQTRDIIELKSRAPQPVVDNLLSTSPTSALSANMGRVLGVRVDAANGSGGFIDPHDFGSATPAQAEITAYALARIGIAEASDIFNGTKVQNLNDGRVWQLANTPGTVPPVFEWVPALVISGAQRDFVANPLQTSELADQAVTAAKLYPSLSFMDVENHYSIFRPDTWPTGKELDFGGGMFGRSFYGHITAETNEASSIKLIDTASFFPISRGGFVEFIDRVGVPHYETGITVNNYVVPDVGYYLYSKGTYARVDKPYFFWVTYKKILFEI